MTETQKQHLNRITEEAHRMIVDKYVKGAAEHKSELNKDFSASQLNNMGLEEVTDLFAYLITARDRIKELEEEVARLKRFNK